jgi:hypothetical protein
MCIVLQKTKQSIGAFFMDQSMIAGIGNIYRSGKGKQIPSCYIMSQQGLLSASQHHVWVFPLLPKRQQKLRMQIVYNGLPKFLGRLLYAYLHPLLGADELSG